MSWILFVCLFVFYRWTSFPLFPACAAILETNLLKKSEIEKIKQVGVGSCRKLFVVPLIYLLQTEFKIANICLILFICPRRKLIFIHASKTFVNIFIVKDIPMQQRYQFKFQCFVDTFSELSSTLQRKPLMEPPNF